MVKKAKALLGIIALVMVMMVAVVTVDSTLAAGKDLPIVTLPTPIVPLQFHYKPCSVS